MSIPRPRAPFGSRLWREMCFLRVAFKHFWKRLCIMLVVLGGCGLLFVTLEPEKNHSLLQATYYSWSLIFGEPPEDFPTHPVLQAMFFIVPVIGLTVIIEGIVDLAVMLGDRRRYERGWCMMMASMLSDHVIVVGLGKLGYQTYRLLRQLGESVVVIERNPQNQFLEEVRRDGAPLLVGDARREAILSDAAIAQARSVIAATDDDLANLEIALDARRLNPHIRVVLRMFDQNMAEKIRDGLNIHIAMSQSAMSAPGFASAAIDPAIVNGYMLDGQLVVLKRWTVQNADPFCDQTLGEITARRGLNVVRRRTTDGGLTLFPGPQTRFAVGDSLLIQGPFKTIQGLGIRS